MIWKEFDVDPLRLHLLIWYQYMYHVDCKMDMPQKLEIGLPNVLRPRDWAANIMSTDGSEPAHCDVVNGGFDQKAYLLMAPQHEAAVKASFEAYRSRVFPFRQREERFRDSIGPPPSVIQVDSKIIANILFIEQMSASFEKWKQSDNAQPAATDEVSRDDSSLG
jgi:hypothetical protein